MNAYLVLTKSGIVAVRCADETKLKHLLGSEWSASKFGQIKPAVADAMAIPNKEGVYREAVWKWVAGPTNILGEVKSN